MEKVLLPPGDEYDKRCGEVFLTKNGSIIFHCTLCENKYKGIHEYAVHIIDKHFDPAILDEDCTSDDLEDSDLLGHENSEEDARDFDVVLFQEVDQLEASFQEEEDETIEEPSSVAEQTTVSAKKKRTRLTKEKVHSSEGMTTKVKTTKTRSQTLAGKIRMVNEEAAMALEAPTFRQPVARAHIPDAERIHKCNFCGFGFKDESNLIAHIKRHSGQRNFQCAFCSKMFCTRNELEEHSRRHTGVRPFKCDFVNCHKTYVTRSELNMHMKRHRNERNYKCEVCERAFYDRSDLREHFVSHTQERNHQCLVCQAKFSRRKALTNHMKLHENKREYECQLCGASFNQKPGLNSHIKTRHKDVD